ncbi:MAG: S41 family peptidase, partial [bacterium]
YEWSGDGKYIAYTGNDRVYYGEVYIVDTQTEKSLPVNITVHHDHDFLGGWAPDGKSIYFLSRRNFQVGLEGYGWWWSGGALYSIPLKNQQPPTSDILFPEKDENKKSGDADQTIIDFDKIEERAWQVTNLRGGGERAAISPDGKTYVFESNALGNWALWSVPFEGGNSKKIVDLPGRVDDIEWLPDGRGFIYMSDRRINFLEKSTGSVMPVPMNGRLTVNLAEERREMVREAARIMKNNFYDEKMHGYDWDEIEKIYESLIADASVGEEFTQLMQMMLGEINASHLGAWTKGSNEGIGFHQAELGLEFDPTTTGPGLNVKYVLPRGPADYDESRVEAGEWVLSIDETPVSTMMNYRALLDNAVATSVVLTVASDQKGSNSRKVKIVPIDRYQSNMYRPSWSEAEYEAWVDRNSSLVDKLSGGRVGYVHIRWMNGGMLERFTRDLFAKNADKDALIIDIRWNPGGNIHEYLLDILSRQRFGWSQPRDGERISQPAHNWGKPNVLLINERSSSDSEIFPSGFRTLKLGTIIGETTLGAVIGTDSYTLIDGRSGIRLPIEGWYSKEGTNLENYGVPPDIRVVNDLNDIRDGIDNQLEYAVKYLIENLGK